METRENMKTSSAVFSAPWPINMDIAARLEEVADILASQHANPYRVQAYRSAAATVRRCDQPMDEIVQRQGLDGLRELPGIGDSLSRSIHQMVVSGRLPMLDRLRGEHDPVETLMSVPGIGRRLAERLHTELGIDTLEELEAAACDNRLADLAGFGDKRITGIRESLATRLGRIRRQVKPTGSEPAVSEILDVDREYRAMADRDVLPRIAPRRFNPQHEAWLPVLHTTRGERHYTVLFSNTEQAHRLDKTHDWVIVYGDGGRGERQYTVITAQRGPLEGRRIVRGRETECAAFYLTPQPV